MLIIDNRESVFDSVVVISDNSLFVSSKSSDSIDAALTAVKAAQNDDEIEAALGGVRIELSNIKKVSCNIYAEMVHVKHQTPKETRSQSISCQDAATTEQILAALKQQLNFNETRQQLGAVRAALKPSIFVVISALLTYFLFNVAQGIAASSDLDTSGRNSFIKRIFVWVMELLGPTGVAIVGGLITLLLVWWLVKRIKQPPLMCILSPA